MNKGTARAKLFNAVAAMHEGPKTVRELTEALGITKLDTAHDYINGMRAAGLVYLCRWERRCNTWTPVWAWCSWSGLVDAPRPTGGTA